MQQSSMLNHIKAGNSGVLQHHSIRTEDTFSLPPTCTIWKPKDINALMEKEYSLEKDGLGYVLLVHSLEQCTEYRDTSTVAD